MRSPTLRQTRLAKKIRFIAENGIKTNKAQLLRSIDYTKATAEGNAHKIFKSQGLKTALQAEGISLENADHVVKSILNSPVVYEMVTPDNQLRAADYISKRLGGYAPEKRVNFNLNAETRALSDEELARLAYYDDVK